MKRMSEREKKESLFRFIASTISIFIMAFNYNLFFLRYEIVAGGASGIATIFHQLLTIKPAVTILIFNDALIIISYYTLGKKSTTRTIIGSIMYPIFVLLTSELAIKLYQYVSFNELIVTVLVSGCIYGFFNGVIYRYGYSTGGMDTLILIVNKYFKISTGSASLILNLFIISCGSLIFGLERAVYGILIIAINKYMINKIQLGISNSKMFYIMTKRAEEVKKVIGRIDSGYTILNTEGGFTSDKSQMIMCVVPTMNYYMFRKEVMKADSDAFIVISDCYEVYGGHIKERLPFI
jgi:uncharacterized membrane-anchored protein YitT (DUF2179 family)